MTRINCLLADSFLAGATARDFAEELARQLEPASVTLNSGDFQTVPQEGYLIGDTDFQFASSWLTEKDYPRLFLLDSEPDPVILKHLERYRMPGAITAANRSSLSSLSDPFYPILRNEVAERLGFERLPGFPSPTYGPYRTNLPLPVFLARYLTAFDQWLEEQQTAPGQDA